MRRMNLVAGVAALGVLAGAVAGCGSSGGSGGGGGNGPALTSNAPTQQVAAQQGGSLTVGANVAITQLNPAVSTFAWEGVLYPLLWSGLTKWTKDGGIGPDLATSWTASTHQKTWTFKLHDGVKFADGTPLDAAAVVKAVDYYLDPKTTTSQRVKLNPIKSVTAQGTDTVVFTLSTPNAVFPSALPDVRIIDVSKLSSINKTPNGSGPFVVKDFVPDDHLTLARNPTYFGPKAPLDTIKLVLAADPTAAASALQAGDLDVVYDFPVSSAKQLQTAPGVQLVLDKHYTAFQSWKIDTTSPPFNNVKARQALAYATDRNAMLNTAYRGFGTVSPANNPLVVGAPGYPSAGLPAYTYDVAKAKKLFAEAGVKSLTWWGPAGIQPEKQTEAELLQASLQKAGVKLKIKDTETSTWTAKFLPVGKKFPGLIVPTQSVGTVEPAYSISYLQDGRCECNWKDADFEKSYTDAIGTADPTARNAAWAKSQQILNQQVPIIIPFSTSIITAASDKVTGVWAALGGGELQLEGAALAK